MSDDSSKSVQKENKAESNWLSLHHRASSSKKVDHNFGSWWRIIASAIAIFAFSQIVAAFFVAIGLSLSGDSEGIANLLEVNALVQFSYFILSEGIAIGLVLAVLKRRKLTLAAIGLGRRPQWSDLLRAVIGILAFYAIVIVITGLITTLLPHLNLDQPQDIGFKDIASPSDQLLAFLSLVILAPIGEEVLVRGYLYSGLRSCWRFIPAMIVTSLLFGAAHLEAGHVSALVWGAALTTFLLSVVLVTLREKTGALYAGIIVHAFNNLIAFGVHFHRVLF